MVVMIIRRFRGLLSGSSLWTFIATLISVMSWKVALALTLMVAVSLMEGLV